MQNHALTGVNNIDFNGPGPNEGIKWNPMNKISRGGTSLKARGAVTLPKYGFLGYIRPTFQKL